jgi:hypothetical protein
VLVFPSVGVALLAAFLALPQGTMPDYLPLPRIAERDVDAARRDLTQRADAAFRQPLHFDVRAAGEWFRRLGKLAHHGQPISVSDRDRFRQALQGARATSGVEAIERLRAVQARLFALALAEWERSGVENADLVELGGDFLEIANDLGWTSEPRGTAGTRGSTSRRRLELSSDEKLALFLVRWNDLAGYDAHPELRLAPVWSLLALRARLRLPIARLDRRDLKLIERAARLDPSYPAALGKGLIFAREHDSENAADAFRTHLQQQPDGPYTLRARNHLQYVLNH